MPTESLAEIIKDVYLETRKSTFENGKDWQALVIELEGGYRINCKANSADRQIIRMTLDNKVKK